MVVISLPFTASTARVHEVLGIEVNKDAAAAAQPYSAAVFCTAETHIFPQNPQKGFAWIDINAVQRSVHL